MALGGKKMERFVLYTTYSVRNLTKPGLSKQEHQPELMCLPSPPPSPSSHFQLFLALTHLCEQKVISTRETAFKKKKKKNSIPSRIITKAFRFPSANSAQPGGLSAGLGSCRESVPTCLWWMKWHLLLHLSAHLTENVGPQPAVTSL